MLIFESLFFISSVSILTMFACVLLLPFAISEEKKKEGHGSMSMLHVPEMYQKVWYREKMQWLRSVFIYSQVVCALSFSAMYVFHAFTK